ncbi:ABC1 kinase family protein [Paenibacillus cymbidii]|uniref:ABC1 kinase family protein n=1 Tax=Paenibacillus cymbidii TaxID=1639034 RepID=UPI00108065B5|nr:AarF/ABC1/UbiB kinase family protein [Paenibacillus cymbidii]
MTKVRIYSKRYREIAKVLFKHGFGLLINRLGLSQLVPVHGDNARHTTTEESLTQPRHLREAFEELGTTFIKMGQILSTRSDLLPSAYIEELSKLQSSVPALDFDVIAAHMAEEYGEGWQSLFAAFDETPLASASIAQVYRAVLITGERVIVKVQRPGIEHKIREDLEIIGEIARLAQNRLRLGKVVDIPDLVQQFGISLLKELDYKQEANNMERFRENFRGSSKLYIPKVYLELMTKRIIVMEEIEGYHVHDAAAMTEAGINTPLLAQNCAEVLLKMIFEDGLFHADLHPGNVFIQRDGTLALIDFGLVGEVDEESRSKLVSLFLAISKRDEDQISEILISLDNEQNQATRGKLSREIHDFLELHLRGTLKEIDMSRAIQNLLQLLYRNQIHVPGQFALLAKTIMMGEEIGKRLDPEFNLTEFISVQTPRLYLRKLRSGRKGKLKQTAFDWLTLSSEAPHLLLKALKKVSADDLEVQINMEQVKPIIREVNKMFNRLALSILTSAILISLALVLLVYRPVAMTSNFGWLFAIGFAVAIIFGIAIMIFIWRSNKKIG